VSKLDVSDLSAGLYEAALNPLLIPAALENIAQSLGCYSYHQLVLDTESHQVTAGWTGDAVDEAVQAAYENHYIRMDDRPLQAFSKGVGRFYVSTDFTTAPAIDRSEIYQDFLIPNGVKHSMGGLSYSDQNSQVLIAFLGAADRAEFSPQERHCLTQLMPHFNNAANLMFKTQALDRLRAENQQLLNTIPTAAFTLSNRSHKILSMNLRAEALLAQGKFFGPSRQSLAAKGPSSAALSALLTRVAKTNIPESMALAPMQRGDVVHITVSRLPDGALLLLVSQPDHSRVATEQQLMQIFKFSPAEARLARAVAHGQTLEIYALEQGVKMTTVRSQIASLHVKAQVSRQTELAKLILSIPCARPPEL
jgi:DNA-binding CsgD family transcriptional regulator